MQVCTLSEVGFSLIFNAVSPKVVGPPVQYASFGSAVVNICALSLGSAPEIINGGESTRPVISMLGPHGSAALVSVVNLDPDMKLSHAVVATNLKDTVLLSNVVNTPGNPLLAISEL